MIENLYVLNRVSHPAFSCCHSSAHFGVNSKMMSSDIRTPKSNLLSVAMKIRLPVYLSANLSL